MITLAFFFIVSCSHKNINTQTFIEGKIFKSKRGHLFGGNTLVFNSNNTFEYEGHGPAIFISNGLWKFDPFLKMIILESYNKNLNHLRSVDTVISSFHQKKLKVLSSRKLMMDGIYYYTNK
jgi:hypothetical protein